MTQIQLKPIDQQVVAVIGASSGIGRSAALEFAKRGAKVAVAARSQPGLDSLVSEIAAIGGEAIAIRADVADFDQVQAIADQTVERFGRLDSWVQGAATSVMGRFEQITLAEFRRVIDVNFMGQVYGVRAALPYLRREGRGALIHISSVEGRRSLPLQSPYSASKHALEGFLDSLRVELQHDGVPVSVTTILPATINTPFYNKSLTKLGVQPTGVPPYYQPQLVARAILHAAEHPTRDLIVGDVGRGLDLLQKVSPQLADWMLRLIAIEGQYTMIPKQESDPNNLFEPIAGYDRAEGDYTDKTIPSVLDWLDWHPAVKWGAAAGLGAIALLAAQILRDDV